jgi:hypothetical protein
MRRFHVRPYGPSIGPTRIISLLIASAVLWLLFSRLRDPATWRILFELKDEEPVAAKPLESQFHETTIAGPNDRNHEEWNRAKEMLQLVTDKSPLKPREMHAYWRLMTWSRTESFDDLRNRSLKDVAFTQLWDQPEHYRGKPVSLRLHVRRVLKYDAPSNPQEIPVVYEAWGWTDESRSYPYVVVFPECSPDLPVGTDVRGEVEFVGYFLKVMSYTAFDTPRGAPLFVGRIRAVGPPVAPPTTRTDPSTIAWVVLAAMLLTGGWVGTQIWMRRGSSRRAATVMPNSIDLQPSNLNREFSDNFAVHIVSSRASPLLSASHASDAEPGAG